VSGLEVVIVVGVTLMGIEMVAVTVEQFGDNHHYYSAAHIVSRQIPVKNNFHMSALY
jgi:hypothetical protein